MTVNAYNNTINNTPPSSSGYAVDPRLTIPTYQAPVGVPTMEYDGMGSTYPPSRYSDLTPLQTSPTLAPLTQDTGRSGNVLQRLGQFDRDNQIAFANSSNNSEAIQRTPDGGVTAVVDVKAALRDIFRTALRGGPGFDSAIANSINKTVLGGSNARISTISGNGQINPSAATQASLPTNALAASIQKKRFGDTYPNIEAQVLTAYMLAFDRFAIADNEATLIEALKTPQGIDLGEGVVITEEQARGLASQIHELVVDSNSATALSVQQLAPRLEEVKKTWERSTKLAGGLDKATDKAIELAGGEGKQAPPQ